jgi:hypothetical protein
MKVEGNTIPWLCLSLEITKFYLAQEATIENEETQWNCVQNGEWYNQIRLAYSMKVEKRTSR